MLVLLSNGQTFLSQQTLLQARRSQGRDATSGSLWVRTQARSSCDLVPDLLGARRVTTASLSDWALPRRMPRLVADFTQSTATSHSSRPHAFRVAGRSPYRDRTPRSGRPARTGLTVGIPARSLTIATHSGSRQSNRRPRPGVASLRGSTEPTVTGFTMGQT